MKIQQQGIGRKAACSCKKLLYYSTNKWKCVGTQAAIPTMEVGENLPNLNPQNSSYLMPLTESRKSLNVRVKGSSPDILLPDSYPSEKGSVNEDDSGISDTTRTPPEPPGFEMLSLATISGDFGINSQGPVSSLLSEETRDTYHQSIEYVNLHNKECLNS